MPMLCLIVFLAVQELCRAVLGSRIGKLSKRVG
jgi:hypothetical protein